MAYKPKTLKSDFVRGASGIATVAFSPDNKKVKITMKEDNKSYIVSMDDCPEEIRKGTWFITMSSDEKKVLGIRPANGVFTAKVQKFVAQEGQDPAPRTKVGSDWSYEYFIVLLDLLNDNAKGMSAPCMLRYHFGEAEEDGKSVVAFTHPKSKYTPLLIECCDVTGVCTRGAMPWKDNVLPLLEKRILRENKTFQVVLKNGYVDSFLELDVDGLEKDYSESKESDEDKADMATDKKLRKPSKKDEPDEETLPDDEG